MVIDKEALKYIFSTQNIRFLAIFSCCECDKKKCDSCQPKTIISSKFEVFEIGGDRNAGQKDWAGLSR
jgi:hypothetical protein